MSAHSRRIVIAGGGAGGTSCARRLRRLDERAGIVMFERGAGAAVAVCGLPYLVGELIAEEAELMPSALEAPFRIDRRAGHEVIAIDRARAEVEVRELAAGRTYREPYDVLVLATGAEPAIPPLPGVEPLAGRQPRTRGGEETGSSENLPGIFIARSAAGCRGIREWISRRRPSRAVIVGGGPLGLEMAENLARRGLKIAVVEAAGHVLPLLDAEMAEPAHRHLESQRVDLRLGEPATGFERGANGTLAVRIGSRRRTVAADMVILATGVRPATGIAAAAGLAMGESGGIQVDEQMRTSDPRIWAAGDAAEVRHAITGARQVYSAAGVAERQGRVAAEAICGRHSRFHGVQSTALCSFFGLAAAVTGASEGSLRRAGFKDYESVYLHPGHCASYYPGVRPLHLKLIFQRPDGRILGAQAVGEESAERRIDVLSMAIGRQATVFDLEESEMCYAPQYGSAKDPVNLAGMVAANVLRGDVSLAPWSEVLTTGPLAGRPPGSRGREEAGFSERVVLVDVRDPGEFAAGSIEGAVNIPLNELRQRTGELPADSELWLYCEVGQRAYYASRTLAQLGRRVRVLSGGYQTYWGWCE